MPAHLVGVVGTGDEVEEPGHHVPARVRDLTLLELDLMSKFSLFSRSMAVISKTHKKLKGQNAKAQDH